MAYGENVGTAYVRIFADGSGMDKQIADDLKRQEPVFQHAGAANSKAYREAMKEEWERSSNKDDLGEVVARSMARANFSKRYFRGAAWKEFRADVVKRYGEVGDVAANAMQTRFQSGGTLLPDNLTAELARATENIQAAENRTHLEALARNEKFNDDILAQLRERHDEALSMNKRFDADRLRGQLDADRLFEAEVERFNDHVSALEFDRVRDQRLSIDAERQANKERLAQFKNLNYQAANVLSGEGRTTLSRRELIRQTSQLADATRGLGDEYIDMTAKMDLHNRRLRETIPAINRYNASIDRTADGIGRAFGKGSRNNFLNFMGSMTANLLKIPKLALGTVSALKKFGTSIVLDGPLKAFGTLAQKMAGVAAGVGILIPLIGSLMSILSLAAGVVAALASTIAFALVAALGAAVAVLLPLIAAVAVTASAFIGLSDAQKAVLKNDFKPLTREFKALGAEARKGLFSEIGATAKALAPAVKRLRPLFLGVSRAVADVGLGWAKATSGAGFKRFSTAMSSFLPRAVRKLGVIFGDVIGGLGGLFVSMIPFMDRFLDAFGNVTESFRKWANDVGNEDQIAGFFRRAGDSARVLVDFLGAVSDLLGEIFSAGRGAGDSLFTSMTTALQGFVTKIQANPQILGDWFDSAKKFGEAIGTIIIGAGKLFAALDNAGTRTAVIGIFTAIGTALRTFGNILNALGPTASTILFGIAGGLFAFGTAARVILPAAAAIRSLAIAMGLLTASSGTGAVAGILGRLGVGAAAAGTGAGAAASGMGLLAAAASPAGLAVAGLAVLFAGQYISSTNAAKIGTDKVTEGLKELATTGETTNFDGLNQSIAEASARLPGMAGALRMVDTGASTFGETMATAAGLNVLPTIFTPGAGKAIAKVDEQLSQMTGQGAINAFNNIQKEANEAGLSFADFIKLYPKSAAAMETWAAQAGVAQEMVRQKSVAASEAVLRQRQDFMLLGAQMNALPTKVKTLIENDALNSLKDVVALNKVYDLTPSQVVTTLAASGVAETVAGVQAARKEFDLTPKQVTTLLTMTGQVETLADLKEYTKGLNLTPKQVETIMKINGIEPAKKSFAQLQAQFEGFPKKVQTALALEGYDLTFSQLSAMALKYEGLDGKQIRTIVSATGMKLTEAQIKELIRLSELANKKKIKPKADLDPRGFNSKRKAMEGAIGGLTKKVARPKAEMITRGFDGKRKLLEGNLKGLDKKKANPKAEMNTKGFDGKNKKVGGDLKALDKKKANPTVGAKIQGALDGMARVARNLANLPKSKNITITTTYVSKGKPPKTAMGGIFAGAQPRIIGEAGPEAVVPLNRALSQVDPAVRWLSAIAQGKTPGMASGGIAGGGRTVEVGGITVVTPNSDARAVASEVINRLVAGAY